MLSDLLVHVSGDEAGRERVTLAVGLAQRTGAQLSGVHITPPPEIPPRYKPSQVDAAIARVAAKLKAEAQVARAIFAEETSQHLADACWFEAEGDVARGVSDRACVADLVILGRDEYQEAGEAHPLPVAHSVVMQCGRPVLVVPVGVRSLVPVKVAIAWDGSREAVRAVHDALPLLKLAIRVHLVTMIRPSDDVEKMGVNGLVAHLANHDIATETRIEYVARSEERSSLQVALKNGGYDLVVMGGYTHRRWLEFIFGGTTLSTLLTTDIPVLVSH
jgi:nucleotide-binding universal stress UspA family protein